jgi:hypothetical protein
MDADTLVTGLIVVAAGGLSILAYRRPTVFNELWRRVRVWLLLALLATILWDWATIVTYLVLKPYLSESAAEAARDAAEGVRILTWTLDFVLIGFMAYMELLRWLIKLLAESESKDKS